MNEMFQKTTGELLHELTQANAPEDYLRGNAGELLTGTLAGELNQLLTAHGISKAKAVRRSGLDRAYGYQILLGYKLPSRNKLLALAIGMALSFAEIRPMLKLAGYQELYARDARDAILIYGIEHGHSIMDINERLLSNGMELLG